MEIWHNLVAFKKIRHWCPLQKKNQLAMGYMIHVKFILFSCIPLSCFRGFHHCRVFWPPRRSNVCLVTKGRQPKRLEFTIKKYISSEIDINFQKNNVSFSWSAVLPKINKHYDTVVVFESFFLSDGYQIQWGVCFGGMTTPPALMPPSDVAHFDKQYLYF